MSAAMSSTRMRQPSCSPKNVTLLPTTGPEVEEQRILAGLQAGEKLLQRLGRIRRLGRVRDRRIGRRGARRPTRRGPRHAEEIRQRASGVGHRLELRADALALLLLCCWFCCGCCGCCAAAAGLACCCWLRLGAFCRRAACRRCRGSARLRQWPRAARRCRRPPSRCRECRPSPTP